MQVLLNNAKLYALQAQMNPHFLFNTINAGVQLSMIEGAERTSEYLESTSRLFRYNIKQLDKPVTIKDEINNIKDYCELLKVRFGDLIHFEFVIDKSGCNHAIPPLILQPLVENAYIHGLSKQEDGGKLKVSTMKTGEGIRIVLEDTGVGMDEDTRRKILDHKLDTESISGNGIGLSNVIERLELFYKKKNIFHIVSQKGVGTKIILELPLREGNND